MSEHGEVPDWVPEERPPTTSGPDVPHVFLGMSDAGGAALPRPAPGGPAGPPPWPPHERQATGGAAKGTGAATGAGAERGIAAGSGGGAGDRPPPVIRRSRWPLIGPLAGAVGLTVLAGLGVYAFATSSGCADGDEIVLSVAAAPGVAPAVTTAAGRLNDAHHKIGSRCVRAEVRSTDPAAVATLLSGSGVAGVTRRPDVWIPDSSLWLAQAQSTSKNTPRTPLVRRGSLAGSPLVVAVPRTLAVRLRSLGTRPSWTDLMKAASGAPTAAGTPVIPKGLVKIQVPDPTRTAPGMATLLLAGRLRSGDEEAATSFTAAVRAIREGVTPSVEAEFASFRRDRQGRYPVALVPEQAVHRYNARGPAEPAVALYPSEGTFTMDHPILSLGTGADQERAGRLLEGALGADETREQLGRLGFRAPDGTAPAAFRDAKTGLDPRAPALLPSPSATAVRATMQAWARLSLSIRMLSIIDISGSMEDTVAPGVTRLQSTVRTAQQGLSLLPDDSELGQWVFSTGLQGPQDYRELVSVGPLGERLGSATRRQLMLSAFAQIKAKRNGDTGLYDTILAAYRRMKDDYKPEFVNSILLWTDGKNDDPGGPTLDATLAALRRELDPARPVLVFMYGYGKGVDAGALRQIAQATRGDVLIADTPDQVQQKFLQAVARRVCAPNC